MRRLLYLVLLATVPLAVGCVLFFVEHPSSTTMGSTVDIDVVLVAASDSSGAETPIACIGLPVSWGTVQSATYQADIHGITPISEPGTLSTPETNSMNAAYAFTTNNEMAAWQCYAGAYTDYGTDTYGTATFQINVGSSGIFTLQYSVGSVSQGPDESMASKPLAVNTSLDDLDRWYASNVEPNDDVGIYRVVYGDSTFVAAGDFSGNISLSSPNGKDWTTSTLPLSGDIRAMTYGNSQFLILEDSGLVARSPDGSSWVDTVFIGFATRAAAYGTGVFVAVGEGGLAAVSSDGAVWSTTQASPSGTDQFDGITYGGGKFSAVGFNGTNPITYASPDGTTWTGATITGIFNQLYDVAYGNSRFVAVGSGGRTMWSTSGSGSWNLVTSGTSEDLIAIHYGNGFFVVVGSNGTMLTSADGVAWSKRASGTGVSLNDVAAGDGGFVVVGESGVIIRQGLAIPSSGGGGGGGGCNTTGPAPGEPTWPEMVWLVLLGGILIVMRRRSLKN